MKIPVSGISALNRSLLQIKGPDATKFLNGLSTSRFLPNIVKKKQHTIDEAENRHAKLSEIININDNWGLMHEDIYDPDNNIFVRRDGLNSMFLSSKGRVVTDCFLYSQPFHNLNGTFEGQISEPTYLIEIDSSFTSQLQMLLKLHKLSAKVSIETIKSMHSYYYYNDTAEFDEYLDFIQQEFFRSRDPVDALNNANSFIKSEVLFNPKLAGNILGFSIDNRIPNFGIKVLMDKEIGDDDNKIPVDDLFSSSFKDNFVVPEILKPESITRRRFMNGLFETQDSPKESSLLPFEMNLDLTNGLSLEKGCYVGQELTIRTYNNGIIRKRIVPIQFFEINDDNLSALDESEYLTLDPNDPVIRELQDLHSSTLSKLEITPLIEKKDSPPPEPEQQSSSPFANSKPVRRRTASSGKLLSIQDNLGFVLANLSDIENVDLYKIELPCLEGGVKHVGIKVFKPEWWPID
ncbi:DEHA2E10318p [Debaryomyces hansenii CBS767]|uniref:Iron-sulfur cluster assembly factor IBA57 homolog, mitochondrial n=1 Tax=Debaryomyces hansenii (strain ATCC 36239 / CBS 767 / BCRC 21394 / JCM 1990 / NBRC 0083 / IGC 2968) TaxID=284592 RepID=CAF17_DEBHA|nr:DEHA2E10318p [Debaryomyces hansenii CBS767]Q6BPW7.2 RecName: Full=Putative transferase CAF17, mitochondrial; Flags: Precursor [Debaryomyces hansenii CBS767]CAG87991.2 DEHA2E10318p [Debaryomyces hansenii CBS767]|eukprot:XP_459753.2 DEHA2E10318p [Debaryomyces hansenii CBS767]